MNDIYNIEVEPKKIIISRAQHIKDKIVYYGLDNQYPSIISNLIDRSQTAVACSLSYSKFLSTPFTKTSMGGVVVGKTSTGKKYTLDMLKKDIAKSIAKFNGAYVLVTKNLEGKVISANCIDFCDVRFSEPDDSGRSNYAYVGDFSYEVVKNGKFDDRFVKYPLFNTNYDVFKAMSKSCCTTASIYHIFLDTQYFYPTSVFEQVAYDMGTEYEIQCNRYNEITQGSPAKLIIRTDFSNDEATREKEVEKIQKFMGSKGDRALIIRTQFDDNGAPISNGYDATTIPDTRDLNSFTDAEKACANNIRKCINIPSILIDYESATGINVSAEQMKASVDYFDTIVEDTRSEISNALAEIFENTVIPFEEKDFSLTQKTIRQ